MITDRNVQFERPATTSPRAPAPRHTLHRPRGAAAPAVARHSSSDVRSQVVSAFRAFAKGVNLGAAQAQAATFYRSSGQVWARLLGGENEPASRAHVAAAFRVTARGVDPRAAGESTLRFFRSSGHEWTRDIGAAM